MADLNVNQNKLMTFSEYNASLGAKAPSPAPNVQAQTPAEKTGESKGDTLIIGGKEITKKKAIGLAALGVALITAIGGGFAAIKRGKVVNGGKETGLFENLKEGLKTIFTKDGKEKYKKILEKGANKGEVPISGKQPETKKTGKKPETKKTGKQHETKTGADKKAEPKKPKAASGEAPAPKTEAKPAAAKPESVGSAAAAPTEAPAIDKHAEEIQAEALRRNRQAALETDAIKREDAYIEKTYGFDKKGNPVIKNSARESAEFFQRVEEVDRDVMSKATPEIRTALGTEFRDYLADTYLTKKAKVAENIAHLQDEFTPRELERIVKKSDYSKGQLKTYLREIYNTEEGVRDILRELHSLGRAKVRATNFADRIQDLPIGDRWRVMGSGFGISEECKKALESLKPEYLVQIPDDTLSVIASNKFSNKHTPERIKRIETLFTPERLKEITDNTRLRTEFKNWLVSDDLIDDPMFLNALGISL